jgi:hypothetical protein
MGSMLGVANAEVTHAEMSGVDVADVEASGGANGREFQEPLQAVPPSIAVDVRDGFYPHLGPVQPFPLQPTPLQPGMASPPLTIPQLVTMGWTRNSTGYILREIQANFYADADETGRYHLLLDTCLSAARIGRGELCVTGCEIPDTWVHALAELGIAVTFEPVSTVPHEPRTEHETRTEYGPITDTVSGTDATLETGFTDTVTARLRW